MEEKTRYEENTDNHSRHASSPRDAEQRDEARHRREGGGEHRPALTRREREDPWPIG